MQHGGRGRSRMQRQERQTCGTLRKNGKYGGRDHEVVKPGSR